MRALSQIRRLAIQEAEFLNQEFVAPRILGMNVGAKIGSVNCSLSISPPDFVGFGVFKPADYRHAKLRREATEAERERYLSIMPKLYMIIAGNDNGKFYGVIRNQGGDQRQLMPEALPINLVREVELFDSIIGRYDGFQVWFDSLDFRRPPKYAEALRLALSEGSAVPTMPGMVPEERWLYGEVLKATAEAKERERRGQAQYRLADALAHAGAIMRSYVERQDGFTVQYSVDGEEHTSTVDKNLRVMSAGICLSGHDQDFSLSSLVSVIREGQWSERIVRTRVR